MALIAGYPDSRHAWRERCCAHTRRKPVAARWLSSCSSSLNALAGIGLSRAVGQKHRDRAAVALDHGEVLITVLAALDRYLVHALILPVPVHLSTDCVGFNGALNGTRPAEDVRHVILVRVVTQGIQHPMRPPLRLLADETARGSTCPDIRSSPAARAVTTTAGRGINDHGLPHAPDAMRARDGVGFDPTHDPRADRQLTVGENAIDGRSDSPPVIQPHEI